MNPDLSGATGATPRGLKPAAGSGELMTVKLRYKQPDGDTSKLISVPVIDEQLTLMEASEDFVFASSVASFGMLLRGQISSTSPSDGAAVASTLTFDAVWETAYGAMGEDYFGYRQEFVKLIERAVQLQSSNP